MGLGVLGAGRANVRVEVARGAGGPARCSVRARWTVKVPRLTARDYQVLGVLAQARCLSHAQVLRLFWPLQDASVCRRRMGLLSKEPRALVKSVQWYTRAGRQRAWALTPAGYIEAEKELGEALDVARDDIGVEYLEHHVHLSELFVGLLAAGVETRAAAAGRLRGPERSRALAACYARARHPYFRWVVSGDRELPWRQPEGGALRERLIRPDAILEFPHSRRRFLVESEMGTHTIAAASPWKPGATTAKANRYEAYCSGLASVQPRATWYQARFPDGFPPEVLFLVRNQGRADSVKAALKGWAARHPTAACSFRVSTVEQALAEYVPLTGQQRTAEGAGHPPPPRSSAARPNEPEATLQSDGGLHLDAAELAALRQFLAAVASEYKARRDRARIQRAEVPDYPPGMRTLHFALQRSPWPARPGASHLPI